MSWKTSWPAPLLSVPGSKPLVTLRNAAALVQELPKAETGQPSRQTVREELVLAAEDRGPLMHGEIAPMNALHLREPVQYPSRKALKGHRKVARDK